MVEFIKAKESDKVDIVDFINYVFSYSHMPHDFKRLLPKAYADDAPNMGAIHYLAKEDGSIKGLVAMRIIEVNANGSILKYGLVGNVSVHPYSRGKGYMKTLMQKAIDDAKELGVDIMVLGGQRQRYGYFGFENAGFDVCYNISSANIRHCFGDLDCSDITLKMLSEACDNDVDTAKKLYENSILHSVRTRDEFVNIMHTWGRKCRVIYKADEMIGYMYGDFHELVLSDEGYMPYVLKAIFETYGLKKAEVKVHSFQKKRMDFLEAICETCSVEQYEMINVLSWENVLKVLTELQSGIIPLSDGNVQFSIGDEKFMMEVSNSIPLVTKIPADTQNTISLSHRDAIRLFFGINSLVVPNIRFKNWLPLPFVIDEPDGF